MASLKASSGVSVHSRIFLAQYILLVIEKEQKFKNYQVKKKGIISSSTSEIHAFYPFSLAVFEKRSTDRRAFWPLPTVVH
jgi:hypothetical protein